MSVADEVRDTSSLPSLCFVCTHPAVLQMLSDAPSADVGGAELQLVQLARLLRGRGWSVSFVGEDAGQPDEITTAEGIRVFRSYRASQTGSPIDWATYKWPRVWHALRRSDANIYVTRGAGWLTGAAALFARFYARKMAFWMASIRDPDDYAQPNGRPWPLWWLYRHGVRASDLVLAQTLEQRKALAKVSGKKAEVVRNVWNISPSVGTAEKSGVLWVGHLYPRKRPGMLLKVAAKLPSLTFTMVGGAVAEDRELFYDVQARAQELPNLYFVGPAPFADMPEYYARAAVLACTSEIEGFPNTFLQAWSSGTPIVSTFDPDGVIAANRIGACCDNAETASEAIRDILGDPEGYREMQQRCREYVREYHSPEAVIPRLESLLINLVSGKEETT